MAYSPFARYCRRAPPETYFLDRRRPRGWENDDWPPISPRRQQARRGRPLRQFIRIQNRVAEETCRIMAGLCRRAVSRACRAGWVADTLVWILTPQYSNAMDMAANVIGGFGEIPISLWL